MMWMRPRGPSDSAASRSKVGQCGRQRPQETHWRASSSKRSRRASLSSTAVTSAPRRAPPRRPRGLAGGAERAGASTSRAAGVHEREAPPGVVGPRALVRRQGDAGVSARHAHGARRQACADGEPAGFVDRLQFCARLARAALARGRRGAPARRRRSRRRWPAGPGSSTTSAAGAAGSRAQRLGECERVAAAGQQPLAPLGQARQAEDGPVDGRVAEQQPAQVVAGDVLDRLGAEREPVDAGRQHAIAQAAVAAPPAVRRRAAAAAPRTVRPAVGVDRQELPGRGRGALHGLERLVAAGAQARVAGPQLRRHRRTPPGARRRRLPAGPCRG